MAEAVFPTRERLSMVAYGKIKHMILQRELPSGAFINEAQLQQTLGLGRTPVREALLKLAQDRLVIFHPRKGVEVARMTPKDVHDIFQTRILLEPAVLRQCFDQVDRQWAAQLREQLICHADDAASQSGETASPLVELDNCFHLGLVDTLQNQYATALIHSLVEFLNFIRITAWHPIRYQASNREHISILDSILAGNLERSCLQLADHLQVSYEEAIHTMLHAPL